MNVKIKHFKLFFMTFLIANSAMGFEMDCGIYEVKGRFNQQTNQLFIYENTEASKKLTLFGDGFKKSFLLADGLHLKVKVKIYDKIGNGDGYAELLKIEKIVNYDRREMQYELILATSCNGN